MLIPEWSAIAGWIVAGILLLVQVIFTAGGLWWEFKQRRKDVDGLGKRVTEISNGVGQRVNRLEKEAEERYLAIVLMVLCPPEKKEMIAQLLQNWKRS